MFSTGIDFNLKLYHKSCGDMHFIKIFYIFDYGNNLLFLQEMLLEINVKMSIKVTQTKSQSTGLSVKLNILINVKGYSSTN